MDNMHLVTGYLGREHVAAADQGAFNAALIGTGQFVLDKGNVFEVQVISNNVVRVLDGELMMQGRFIRLEPGNYVDLTIENGSQGMKRNDLIAVRYTKDASSGVEGVNLVVIRGTAVASNPVDPAYTEGDITNGEAYTHDYPLWRIPLDGLNVGEPVALFGELFADSMLTLPGIRNSVETIHSEVAAKLVEFEKRLNETLLNAAIRYVPLKTIVTEEDLAQIDVDLSDIDWNVYPQIILTVKGEGSNNPNGFLLMNGDADNHYKMVADTGAENVTNYAGGFSVNFNQTRSFSRITISGDCNTPQCHIFRSGRYVSTETYIYTGSDGSGATLETLNLIKIPSGSSVFLAGLTINIYGAKY